MQSEGIVHAQVGEVYRRVAVEIHAAIGEAVHHVAEQRAVHLLAPAQLGFHLFMLGDVGDHRLQAGVSIQRDQLGRVVTDHMCSVQAPEPDLAVKDTAAFAHDLDQFLALFGTDVQPQLRSRAAEHLVPLGAE